MFDVIKANADLHAMFADARKRFPEMDAETLWGTCKAVVAAGAALDVAVAKRRATEPDYTPSPDVVAFAFGRAAQQYIPGAKQ